MNKKTIATIAVALLGLTMIGADTDGCDGTTGRPQSSSGVNKANVTVPVGPDNLTVEQRNVRDRLLADNKPGSIKHLYVISSYSGQVLIYSTVRGKVSSSGKRLTPTSVVGGYHDGWYGGFAVDIGGNRMVTNEVLQDDGSYGDSVPYIFWFDSKGVYHQHFVEGGQIVHISSEPLAVKSVVLNLEMTSADTAAEDTTPQTPPTTTKGRK